MRVSVRLLAAVFAAASIWPCVVVRADDEEKPAAKTEKAAEKPAPADVTTPGVIAVGGQHIAYNAIAGTITVGATDTQDAQLGMDGKPQAESQLATRTRPRRRRTLSRRRGCSYVAYFKKDAKAEDRPITFFYNGGPGSSTVWLHMGSLGPKHVVTDTETSTCRRRRTSWWTMRIHCWM